MADFPGSVFNPATRSAGQTIASAHVNNLQAEVTAIEDGYRNATAPLNSSGSTVATLSVLGASTFASRPVTPPPDMVYLQHGSTMAVGGTSTSINWLTQVIATNSSLHSTATNSSRITPQSTGVYEISAQATFGVNSSGYRELTIEDSSGAALVASYNVGSAVNAALVVHARAWKRFDVTGGWVRVSVSQTGASTMSLDSPTQTQCMVKKL